MLKLHLVLYTVIFLLSGCTTSHNNNINTLNEFNECKIDSDCQKDYLCRLRLEGGKECRAKFSFKKDEIINKAITNNNENENIEPKNKNLTNHLKEDVYLGEVKATIHNFCSPMLDECEHFVVLKYKNNILKHHTRYPSDFQFPKDGIKQDGNYITVESASKGNCRDCIGIDVFKIKNDKILSIGYFLGIEGNFLVSLYTELETNNITSHATSPIWTVYYKENDGKLILDTNKTCNNFDEGYIENKNNLFKEIRLREKSGKTMLDEIEIYDSVLSILSYSKWCGFENESLEIVTKIRDSGLSFNYEIRQLLNKYISETKKLDDSSVLKKIHGDLNNDVESIAR